MSKWTNTKEQLDFRDKVFDATVQKKAKKKAPSPELVRVKKVSGTSIAMKEDAAIAAERLLNAANDALKSSQAAGDADALVTKKISANSGYRSPSRQKDIWMDYFAGKYYDRTAKYRATLPGGEHGEAAIEYMSGYISPKVAAPGYSDHQAGIAIDFGQRRAKGFSIPNDTDKEDRKRWVETWFYGWLKVHASEFGFEPYPPTKEGFFEPWHWTYSDDSAELLNTTDPKDNDNSPSHNEMESINQMSLPDDGRMLEDAQYPTSLPDDDGVAGDAQYPTSLPGDDGVSEDAQDQVSLPDDDGVPEDADDQVSLPDYDGAPEGVQYPTSLPNEDAVSEDASYPKSVTVDVNSDNALVDQTADDAITSSSPEHSLDATSLDIGAEGADVGNESPGMSMGLPDSGGDDYSTSQPSDNFSNDGSDGTAIEEQLPDDGVSTMEVQLLDTSNINMSEAPVDYDVSGVEGAQVETQQ